MCNLFIAIVTVKKTQDQYGRHRKPAPVATETTPPVRNAPQIDGDWPQD